MITDLLFATPVTEYDLDLSICNDAKKILLQEVEFDTYPLNYCTKDDLNIRPEFADVRECIEQASRHYALEVLKVDFDTLSLTGMWANVHKNNFGHCIHQHPNSFFSGVVYIDVPDDMKGGDLILVDPRQAKNMVYPNFIGESAISDRWMTYTPKTGKILLFPSWLEHGTNAYLSDSGSYRISMSFNYQLIKSDFGYGRF